MVRVLLSFCIAFYCIISFHTCALAESNEWRSANYPFEHVKKVLVMEPQFIYSDISEDSHDWFEKYPYGQEKFTETFNENLKKFKCKFYDLGYIDTQIKGDPGLPLMEEGNVEGFTTVRQQQLPKYADVILSVEIRDYGWFHEYNEAYSSQETVKEKIESGGTTEDGKEYHSWMEIPKEITVYHPAHYEIHDEANLKIWMTDVKTNKVVWAYSDSRYRISFSWSGGRDGSGPESMMNRILDAVFNKVPLPGKQED